MSEEIVKDNVEEMLEDIPEQTETPTFIIAYRSKKPNVIYSYLYSVYTKVDKQKVFDVNSLCNLFDKFAEYYLNISLSNDIEIEIPFQNEINMSLIDELTLTYAVISGEVYNAFLSNELTLTYAVISGEVYNASLTNMLTVTPATTCLNGKDLTLSLTATVTVEL